MSGCREFSAVVPAALWNVTGLRGRPARGRPGAVLEFLTSKHERALLLRVPLAETLSVETLSADLQAERPVAHASSMQPHAFRLASVFGAGLPGCSIS